jgi:hypothetical protein
MVQGSLKEVLENNIQQSCISMWNASTTLAKQLLSLSLLPLGVPNIIIGNKAMSLCEFLIVIVEMGTFKFCSFFSFSTCTAQSH